MIAYILLPLAVALVLVLAFGSMTLDADRAREQRRDQLRAEQEELYRWLLTRMWTSEPVLRGNQRVVPGNLHGRSFDVHVPLEPDLIMAVYPLANLELPAGMRLWQPNDGRTLADAVSAGTAIGLWSIEKGDVDQARQLPEPFWQELHEWAHRCRWARGEGTLFDATIVIERDRLEVRNISRSPQKANRTLDDVAAFVARIDTFH